MTFRTMSDRQAQLQAAYVARREPKRPDTGLGEWLAHNRAVTAHACRTRRYRSNVARWLAGID